MKQTWNTQDLPYTTEQRLGKEINTQRWCSVTAHCIYDRGQEGQELSQSRDGDPGACMSHGKEHGRMSILLSILHIDSHTDAAADKISKLLASGQAK